MATDGSQLYVGGDFTKVNGVGQQGIARFTSTTDYPTPKPAAPIVTQHADRCRSTSRRSRRSTSMTRTW